MTAMTSAGEQTWVSWAMLTGLTWGCSLRNGCSGVRMTGREEEEWGSGVRCLGSGMSRKWDFKSQISNFKFQIVGSCGLRPFDKLRVFASL
jgi:hypothetical protein